jgi:hypothetical protein
MDAVVSEQRGGLNVSDGVAQLTSSMGMRGLQMLKVRDRRADESLQMGYVLMILMVMANMRMSMVAHGDFVIAMLGMMNMNFMRHNY